MSQCGVSTTTNITNSTTAAQSEWPQAANESFESLHSATFVASLMH